MANNIIGLGAYSSVIGSQGKVSIHKLAKEKQSKSAEMGEAIHQMVQAEFARKGLSSSAETVLVDSQNLLVSKIDITLKDGTPVEVKTVGLAELVSMTQPRPAHVAQLAYYIQQQGLPRGILLYVAREAPGQRKAFDVGANGAIGVNPAAFMAAKRGGVSLGKFNYALDESIASQRSNSFLKANERALIQEVETLQTRERAIQRKRDWEQTYKVIQSGLYEKAMLNQSGIGRHIDEWGSPWRKKKSWKEYPQLSYGVDSIRQLQYERSVTTEEQRKHLLSQLQKKESRARRQFSRILKEKQEIDRLKKIELAEQARIEKLPPDKRPTVTREGLERNKRERAQMKTKGLDEKIRAQIEERKASVLRRNLQKKEEQYFRKQNLELEAQRQRLGVPSLSLIDTNTPSNTKIEIPTLKDVKRAFLKRDRELVNQLIKEGITSKEELMKRVYFPSSLSTAGLDTAKKTKAFLDDYYKPSLEKMIDSTLARRLRLMDSSTLPNMSIQRDGSSFNIPTKPNHKFLGGKETIFFDLETNISRKGSNTTPYIFEFGAVNLSKAEVESIQDLQGLEKLQKSLRQENVIKNQNKVLNLKASILSENAIDKIERAKSVQELQKAGILGDESLDFYKRLYADRRKNGEAGSFLGFIKQEVNSIKVATLNSEGKINGKYSSFSRAESLDEVIKSQKMMSQRISSFFGENIPQLAGHNIVDFDINQLISHSNALRDETNLTRRLAMANKVDTLRAGYFNSFADTLKENLRTLGENENLFGKVIGGIDRDGKKSTLAALENLSLAMGFTSEEMRKEGAHRALFDVNANISMISYIDEYMHAESAKQLEMSKEIARRFEGMAAGENLGATRSIQNQTLNTLGEDLLSATPRQVQKEIPVPQFLRDVDDIFRQAKTTVQSGAKTIGKIGNVIEDTVLDFLNKDFKGNEIKLNQVRRPAIAGLGILAIGAGIGIASLSSSMNTNKYRNKRPIETTAPIMTSNDEAHTMPRTSSSMYTESNRSMLTDFGSGYQGMKGSILGLIKTIKGAPKPVAHMNPISFQTQVKDRLLPRLIEQRPHPIPVSNVAYKKMDTSVNLKYQEQNLRQEVANRARTIKKRNLWFQRANLGTQPVFVSNKNRIGHYRM